MSDARWSVAKVLDRIDWAEGLFTLRTDAQLDSFQPGQHVSVGVNDGGRRVHRLFSIASAPGEPLEFLVVRVEGGVLSPRLDRLKPGDELWVQREARGQFVLDRVGPARELWMFATGAGLAPYVSMLRTETPWDRFERILLVHGVRRPADVTYREELARRSQDHGDKLRTLSCVTQHAPENGMLSGRITAALSEGRLEKATGVAPDPERSQVLLCGNPDMIKDMTLLLQKRGFRENGRIPGNITTERYW